MARWKIYRVQARHEKLLFIMYVVFLKITTFLRTNLILHPGHTSLFLKTVTIKFMGLRGRGPTHGNEG